MPSCSVREKRHMNTVSTYRADYSKSDMSGLFSGDTQFESLPEHQGLMVSSILPDEYCNHP